MMTVGKYRIKSFMTLEFNFSGIRIIEQELTPVDWALKINLVAANSKGRTQEEMEINANMMYQKIYFWLETNLPHSVLVNVTDEDDLYIANLSSNIMVYCPDNPTDDLFVQLLHAKISTLAEHSLFVGEMELKGSDTTLRYTYSCPDANYGLPTKTAEYYTDEGVSKYESPWWYRDDGFCFEFIRPVDSTETDEELFGEIIDPMIEFKNTVNELEQVSITKEPAKIIQVEKWIPRKI